MYDSINLSKYIISKCVEDNHPISHLQLQKILYFIQRMFLRMDRRAFADEIEAWRFGPVVPQVYYEFSVFGADPICFTFSGGSVNAEDKENIDNLVVAKRTLRPWDLVAESHKNGGAWSRIYNNGQGNHQVIPTEMIKKFG